MFGQKSRENLKGVDARLVNVFNEVVKHFDCTILDGVRTKERQAELVAQGKSKTMASKHIEGQALDVAPYPVDWNDTNRFYYFSGFVMGVASQMGIKVRWGGDWNNDKNLKDNKFDDLVHYELG